MTSYTSYFVFSFLVVMMMMMPINSNDLQSRSESELYSNTFSKNDDFTIDKRPSFFVGSRYGRSPQVYGTKARRLSVAPRNDRFFLGSRYGKRSNEYTIPSDLYNDNEDSTIPTESIILNKSNDNNNYYKISCIYTGFKNYFKCNTENNIRH